MKIIVITGDTFSRFNGNYYSQKPDVSFIQKVFGKKNVLVIGPYIEANIDNWTSKIEVKSFLSISLQPHFNTRLFLFDSIIRPWRLLKLRKEVDEVILSNDDAIFWVRTPSPGGLYFAKRVMNYNRRLICHIAGDARDTWKDSKYNMLLRNFARVYSMVVLKKLKDILHYERSFVFCSGVKLLMFAADHSERTALLVDTIVEKSIDYLPRNSDVIQLLYVGRLVIDKGLDLLLEAIAHHKDGEGLSFGLDIVGSGLDEWVFKDKVEQLNLNEQVRFHGVRSGDELISYYRKADVLVVPTKTNEGLPRVIFEAWSLGLPVLVSDVGGMPYAVDHNVDGLIFDRDDLSSLINVLSMIKHSDILTKLTLGAMKRSDTADFNYWKRVVNTHLSKVG